jgi:hypothetical protein
LFPGIWLPDLCISQSLADAELPSLQSQHLCLL